MANYPDWVLMHKPKGVYVVKKKDAYYLYRAHSERVKGTNKINRVFDGYIGRVTEKDGFIPVRDKIQGELLVYDFGMPAFLYALCEDIYKGFKKSHRSYADTIFALAIANILNIPQENIPNSVLPLLFKNFSDKQIHKPDVAFQCDRCISMINSYLSTKVEKDDLSSIHQLFPQIHLVFVNEAYYISYIHNSVQVLFDKYQVEVKRYVKNF